MLLQIFVEALDFRSNPFILLRDTLCNCCLLLVVAVSQSTTGLLDMETPLFHNASPTLVLSHKCDPEQSELSGGSYHRHS